MQKDKEKTRMYNAIYVLAVVIIGFICLLANFIYNKGAADTVFNESELSAETNTEPLLLTVYITGEVASPGLYEFEPGIRIAEAIEKAGGATPNADLESVNLAKVLNDGDQVKVPAVKKTRTSASTKTTKSENNEKAPVNINCGDVSEYMKLSGMTEEIAANIVKHIELYGSFQSTEELQFVEGMTPTLYKKLAAQFEQQ